MKNINTLKTVANYARMQNVTAAYIYKLIKEKRMEAVIIDKVKFIDFSKYPTLKG